MIRPRLRRPRSEENELPDLPPLDQEDRVGIESEVGEEYAFDVGESAIDDIADESDSDDSELSQNEQEYGWTRDSDDADETDVGDLSDEIATEGEDTWLSDPSETSVTDDGADSISDEDARESDDPEDGPIESESDGSASDDLEDMRDRSDEAGEGEESESDAWAGDGDGLPAFMLPVLTDIHSVRIETDGTVLAAALVGKRIVLCGDGFFGTSSTSGTETTDGTRTARRIATTIDTFVGSIVSVGARALVAATLDGHILRSDDGGNAWEKIAALGTEDSATTGIELLAEPIGENPRLWARAHAGGLFRSENGGRTWDGPLLEQPIRAIATDPRLGGVIVARSGLNADVQRSTDGNKWIATQVKLPESPVQIACRGDVWAFAMARGPGWLTVDAGKTIVPWEILTGCTALVLTEADDGAIQILAAMHDSQRDRAVLIRAAVDSHGAPRNAVQIADVDVLFPTKLDAHDEADDGSIEMLLTLDALAERVLVVTARGVAIVSREPFSGAKPKISS